MKYLNFTYLFLIFVYIIFLLFGYPKWKISDNLGEDFSKIAKHIKDHREKETRDFTWEIGLFKKTYWQYLTFQNIQEKELEGDIKPKETFQRLGRLQFQYILQTIICFIIMLFILFLLGTTNCSFSFLNRFRNIIIGGTLLFILFQFFEKLPRNEISLSFISLYEYLLGIYFLLYVSLHFFIGRKEIFSKGKKAKVTLDFGKMLWYFLIHFLCICITSIILANLLLLPLYTLQFLFPKFFTIFLIAIIMLLVFYYTYFYSYKFNFESNFKNGILGITFLSYRCLKNTFLLGMILFLVFLLITSVIYIIHLNIKIIGI